MPSTGNGVLVGENPFDLEIKSIGATYASSLPYGGRYPCGSLVYNGVWYYGTYCLGSYGNTVYEGNNQIWNIHRMVKLIL